MSNWLVAFSGLFGALGVISGALGSHALKTRLPASDLEVFNTAVIYLLVHSAVLLGCGVALNANEANLWLKLAGAFLVVGIVLFPGGLILRSVTGDTLFGQFAPIGGSALILGWVAIAIGGMVNIGQIK
jgi:uncharacterized membrane protein YgdD (TMEM256/DUF423 family)